MHFRRILDFEQKLRESKDTTMGEVSLCFMLCCVMVCRLGIATKCHVNKCSTACWPVQVRALLVSRTYATREDVSRAVAQAQGAAQVIGTMHDDTI